MAGLRLSPRGALAALFVLIAVTRLCHLNLLWIEEAYSSAAAAEMLRGHALYRDIWFDKPPLYALVYVLWGAQAGWLLRIGGIAFVWTACLLAYRFARNRWSEKEGAAAAWLLGLPLTFGIPSAVIALAPDLLMILPHMAAIYLAWRGRAFISGLAAGVAFLCNTKATFVLAACLLWQWHVAVPLLSGFLLPSIIFWLWLAASGSVAAYWEQVWVTGWQYSQDTFVTHPVSEALRRTANWAGFYGTLVAGAAVWWWRERDWRFIGWALLAFASVFAGWRFFPRYYFSLLPPLAIAGARGLMLLTPRWRVALATWCLLPIGRFGPSYGKAISGQSWSDTALMEDSRKVASLLRRNPHAEDSLFIWGYRPDIFVFSGLQAGSPFLDSQPISGIFADRHLSSAHVSSRDTNARAARLSESRPTFLVDGLGLLNPELSMGKDTRLNKWLLNYREIARTPKSILYRKVP